MGLEGLVYKAKSELKTKALPAGLAVAATAADSITAVLMVNSYGISTETNKLAVSLMEAHGHLYGMMIHSAIYLGLYLPIGYFGGKLLSGIFKQKRLENSIFYVYAAARALGAFANIDFISNHMVTLS